MFYISVALEEIFLFILLNNFVPQFTEVSLVSRECSINCYSCANIENKISTSKLSVVQGDSISSIRLVTPYFMSLLSA